MAALPWMRQLPRGRPPGDDLPGPRAPTTPAPRRCAPLLDSLGYHTHPWGQGFNFGPRTGVLERCEHDLRRLRQRWPQTQPRGLGLGLRPLRPRAGQGLPGRVRSVVTLGTPFADHPAPRTPGASSSWSAARTRTTRPCWTNCASRRPCPPPRSTRAVTASWPGTARSTSRPLVENIEVHASHIGLGFSRWLCTLWPTAWPRLRDTGNDLSNRTARKWFYRTPSSAAD